MTSKRLALLCIAWLLALPAAAAENHFAVLGDLLIEPDDKHRPQQDSGVGIDLRYGGQRPDGWGYEARLFYGGIEPRDGTAEDGSRGGIGVDALYRGGALLGIRPYVLGGIGLAYNDALPGRSWLGAMINAGLGLATGSLFEIAGRGLRLRAEARYSYEDYRDDYTDATTYDASNYLDLRGFIGIELALERPAPPPPREPVEVVPPVSP